ncbi:peptidyl-prolyl cis-trans isomerase [Pseudooctadecabacter sp.]|uniref:peptidylprolyl isomerase n=1 Tax=Pseudooctadecabacter sp. TaxID=1966338 RepID=UPI0035C7EDA7
MAKASKTRNFFVWIVMGLLFIGLMGFGATGLSGTVRAIGNAGDKPIAAQSYYLELQNRIASASAEQGRQISFPEAEAQGIPATALQVVVGQRSLDNEAAVLGLSVGDDIISEQVLGNPAFRDINGAFDRAQYRGTLARSGISVREYENTLRDQATRALVQGAVFTGIPDPLTYAETLAQFSREGRTFTWAPLADADVEVALPEPSEEDLQAHYDANPDLYRTLETRQIRYVWLTPDMIQDDMPVDEDELRAEYDARLEEYQQPERRLVERLVFSDEEAAAAALAQIEAGETTFPDLVAARGLTLSDVDIGDVTEAQMDDAGPAIFAAETGDIVGPFPSDLGPALFRMNAILSARNITFEQALPDLREDQAAARARRLIEDQIDPITNLLAGGAQLSDVADQTEMQLGEITWTTDVTNGIAAYASFRDIAAATDVGDFAEVEELDDGGLFALEVTDIIAPMVPPLDDIRADVIAGWEAEVTAQAIVDDAESRAAQLREGREFAALDLDAVQETNLTRRGFVNGTPPTFLTEVFTMELGDVRVLENSGGAIIVRLDGVTPAEDTDSAFAAEVASIAESSSQGIAQDIYELYTRNIQVNTDVTLNQAAINSIHSNFR